MKTHYNDPAYAKRVALLTAQAMHIYPPAIPFQRKKKGKKDKKDDMECKNIDVPLDSSNPEDTTEWNVPMFDTGDPEDWIKWKIHYEKLQVRYPLDTADKQNNMLLTLLQGEAYDIYTNKYADGIDKARTEDSKKNLVKASLNAVAVNIFDDEATCWRRQKSYMRYNLYFEQGQLKTFKLRLYELNKYLKYFPIPKGKTKVDSLDEDELLEIIDRAKPIQYQQDCLKSNIDPFTKTPNEYLEFLERLETSAKIEEAIKENDKPKAKTKSKGNNNKGKRKRNLDQDDDSNDKHCTKCGKEGHEYKDCWYNPRNKNKRPKWVKDSKGKPKEESANTITFTKDQFNYLCTTLPNFQNNKKRKKRKVKDDSSSEGDETSKYMSKLKKTHRSNKDTSDEDSDYSYVLEYNHSLSERPNKKRKKSHKTTEVIGEITNKEGETVAIRILIDTGTTSSIILKPFVHGNVSRYKSKTTWNTMGGKFETKRKALINFKLPEFSTNKTITSVMHVDESTDPDKSPFDMIIGTDLITDLELEMSFKNKIITWDDVSIPMKERGTITDKQTTEDIYAIATDVPILKMSEDRHNEIIKIMYSEVDITEYVQGLPQLSNEEQIQLKQILEKYPEMYKGQIGTLKIPPVHFELKKDAVPYSARAFPIPKAYEHLTKEECKRFVKANIWKHVYDSEWAAPSFIGGRAETGS